MDPDRSAELLNRMFTDPTMLAYGKGPFSKIDAEGVKSGEW